MRDGVGISQHYDPDKVTLIMTDCTLFNRKEDAQKIMDGGHKRVCAWLLCEDIEVTDKLAIVGTKDGHLMFNPRITRHWVMDGEDMDGRKTPLIYSSGRELYIPENGLNNVEDDN